MTQKKRASWMMFGLRLLRPLIHSVLLAVIFRGSYLLRQKTDGLPGIQLRLPGILISDLVTFAASSIVLFIIIAFVQNVYELHKPLHGYYTRFFKTWMLRFVSMTFLALFGEQFIFAQGISRFIILIVAVGSFFLLSIFDIFWNDWNSRLESRYPYKVLAIYENHALLDQFLDEFEDYPIYDIRAITLEEYDAERRWDKVNIVVVLGTHNQGQMQTIADHARLQGRSLYHVPESYFLEDLVSSSARLGPIVALEHKPSPLEGWYRVGKR
jgi:hypothetical protein